LNIVLCVLILVSVFVWGKVNLNPLQNFIKYPMLIIFPLIGLVGLLNLFRIKKFKKDGIGFLSSSLFLFGAFASTASALFPVLLPSTNAVNPSLTIFNASAETYGLTIGIYWWIIAFVLVIIYFVTQYKIFKGKMDDVPYGHH